MSRRAIWIGIGCSFAICLGAIAPIGCYLLTPKSRAKADSSAWMAGVSDAKSIAELSLPGTHDSGALYSIADVAGKCQDFSIKEQLSIGARFLDVRLQQVGSSFTVTHGFINEDLSFDSVLSDCVSFLSAHPTETLVLSIKEETDAKKPVGTFDEALKNRLSKLGDQINFGRTVPLLGDVRGKMSILSRYPDSSFGIEAYSEWEEPGEETGTFDLSATAPVHVQDYYKFNDIEKKVSEVKKCLEYSSSSSTWTINFFSGYFLNSFPPSYSVPVASKMNAWGKEHLSEYPSSGTVLFDFATEELCRLVWSKNL